MGGVIIRLRGLVGVFWGICVGGDGCIGGRGCWGEVCIGVGGIFIRLIGVVGCFGGMISFGWGIC